MNFLDLAVGILTEGLIYSILAFGVYISLKILDFPDLSTDGTFPLGMAVATVCLINGLNPFLCIVLLASGLSLLTSNNYIQIIFWGVGVAVIALIILTVREMWQKSHKDTFFYLIFLPMKSLSIFHFYLG